MRLASTVQHRRCTIVGMIRIISGERRGRKIDVPPGQTVRPPSDRARQAMFDQVRPLLAGRPVFDLFAGSGAFGLEALSRGAPVCTFVELDRRVAGVLRQNIAHLGYTDRSTVFVHDAFRWVRRADIVPVEPAVIFVAPPYAFYRRCLEDVQELWQELIARFAVDTALVFQLNGQFDVAELPAGQQWDVRAYGDVKSAICQTQRSTDASIVAGDANPAAAGDASDTIGETSNTTGDASAITGDKSDTTGEPSVTAATRRSTTSNQR